MIDKKSKTRLLAVTVVLLAVIGYMIYSSSTSSLQYFKKIDEVRADKTLIGKSVRVGGKVLPGSKQQKGHTTTFTIVDKNQKLNVVYSGQMPSTFGDNVQAIVEGKLVSLDKVEANSVVTTCPSKYKEKKIGG